MWIVETALRRPYTFIVMALLILLALPYTLLKTPVDILPEINIPVISIVWGYNGLSANDMGQRITAVSERSLTTTVDGIEHIESQSLAGVAVIKIFFQPNTNIQTAIAQTVSIVQAQIKAMPPGITPPLIIKYSASSVPVIQLGLSSAILPEQELFDIGMNILRPKLVTIPGAAVPYPYGGKSRVISVDLDTQAMLSKNLSPNDIVSAIGTQNLILPSGTIKMGMLESVVNVQASPQTIDALNDIPIRSVNGVTIYLKEVAHVRDGFSPQTNVIRQNGQRGVLISLIKNGDASTLDIISNLKELIPNLINTLPKELNIKIISDQSVFVKAAINGVVHEALIAGLLTAILILLFLGNWRSTLIIAVSIPLSIMTSIIMLHILGQTINIMTLGGLALAVGILVDDATVTIENIERHLHMGTDLHQAILDGAGEIAIPALVSTLCICIVFTPMFFLTGVAKHLFTPLAESVIFAMLASYLLSRTLVPTLVMLMMQKSHDDEKLNLFKVIYLKFNAAFEKLRDFYVVLLKKALNNRRIFISLFLGFCIMSCGLYAMLGQDFFPTVDAGKIRLHIRAPTGTRIEETARLTDQVEIEIRRIIPQQQLDSILDNIGLPMSGINLSYSNAGTIGTFDSEVLISLNQEHDNPQFFEDKLRNELPKKFPGVEFYFQPADIVTQILNFGLPASIDIQLSGNDLLHNKLAAIGLLRKIKQIPGAVDVHIQQRMDQPSLDVAMDLTRMQQLGLNAITLAQNVLVSLSGSFQTAPSFWLNPSNGIVYNVVTQTPQYQIDSLDKLLQTPVNIPNNTPQLLSNLVKLTPSVQQAVVSHYNISPVIDIDVSVKGRDLGSVAKEVQGLISQAEHKLPKGSKIAMRGQIETMQSSFLGLEVGLAIAIILVYLLIVVNFQSWTDPLIIITALPAAIAGIAWMLFVTGTTLSVPALTGAIMTMGVATANSILVISFARKRLNEGMNAIEAALDAGATRIRPVIMTAMAMIVGMIPMAIGLGEGAEQNAPLGRAAIGGLIFATISTLFFVPAIFASVHGRLEKRSTTIDESYSRHE